MNEGRADDESLPGKIQTPRTFVLEHSSFGNLDFVILCLAALRTDFTAEKALIFPFAATSDHERCFTRSPIHDKSLRFLTPPAHQHAPSPDDRQSRHRQNLWLRHGVEFSQSECHRTQRGHQL